MEHEKLVLVFPIGLIKYCCVKGLLYTRDYVAGDKKKTTKNYGLWSHRRTNENT